MVGLVRADGFGFGGVPERGVGFFAGLAARAAFFGFGGVPDRGVVFFMRYWLPLQNLGETVTVVSSVSSRDSHP